MGKSPVPGHDPTSADPLIAMPGQGIDGYQVTKIDAMGNATDSFYDHAGRLTDVWLPAVADARQPDPNHAGQYLTARPHWHYAYDASGDETAQTDPDGHTTTFAYDEQGHQVVKTLPDSETTRSFYDAHGLLLATKLYASATATAAVKTTTYGFNYYHPDRVADEYRFNGDVPVTQGSGSAESTHYTYDDPGAGLPASEQLGLGRVGQVDEYVNNGTALVHSTHTVYDPATGQPSSIKTDEGLIHYEYDPKSGRHVRTWTDHNGTVGNDTAYAYDAQGRLQDVYEVVLNGARYATYAGLDATGQPTFTGGTPPTTAYTYDLAGNLQTESLPDGVTTTYSYDDLNRLTDLSSKNMTTNDLVFTQHYDLRTDGLRSDVVETRYNTPDGSLFSKTKVNWTYDADGRLTDEAETILNDGTGGTTNTNGHAPAAYSDHYAFDLANNRLVKQIAGGATITYTYSGDDQLATESDGSTYDTRYFYDTSGNQTSKTVKAHGTGTVTESDVYTWDQRNRMIEVSMTAGTVNTDTTYVYDSNGVRVSETTGGTSTYYLNDPMNPTGYAKAVEETATRDTAPARSYVFGLGVEGQSDGTNGVQYLLHDGHGSTRALLNVTGGIIQRYDYYAYGEALGFDAKLAKTMWLFGGDGLYDPSSGFTYNLARWRDGFRFVSQDIGPQDTSDPQSLHKYLYANGDPINGSDPSGHFDLVELGITTGILAGVGATLGVGINGINNYAVGKSFFNGAAGAAAFGAVGLPLSVAFPFVGIALAGLGIYSSGATAYQVFTNPNASASQKGAAAFLVGLSLFGAYSAASSGSSGGSLWVNAKYFNSAGASAGSMTSYQAALDNVRNYTGALKDALSGTAQEGRITMAVGVAEDASGNRITLIGTSEKNGYIRPQISPVIYGWGGRIVKGTGHAEADVVAYAAARGWKLIGVGATRPICAPCAQEIAGAGATAATALK